MSSLLRRMTLNARNIGTNKPGKYVGLVNPDCKCCKAKQIRDGKKGGKS